MIRIASFLTLLLLSMAALAQLPEGRSIRPLDTLQIVCEEEASLSKDYPVTRDGMVVLPFVGAISVTGLTEKQAADEIVKQLLAQRILRKATVTVKLLAPDAKPIRFAGAVKVSGEVPYRADLRLSDIVTLAIPTSSANLGAIEIVTAEGRKLVVAFDQEALSDPAKNPTLQSGDTVLFPVLTSPADVLVLGGVAKPGAYRFVDQMSVSRAIELAGGIGVLGNRNRVRLERGKDSPKVLDLDRVDTEVLLRPGDRIVVELRPVRRYLQVTGEVAKPGTVEYRDGMTLSQAIQDAGGLLRLPADARVGIIPVDSKTGKVVWYDFGKIKQGLIGDIKLNPGDKVVVQRARGRSGPRSAR